jgi:hypothetical protein
MRRARAALITLVTGLLATTAALAENNARANTAEPTQVSALAGWQTAPLFTVGETINGYKPVGILDGIGAFAYSNEIARVVVNHELAAPRGYAYSLANGTSLTGARLSYFDIDRNSRMVVGAGPAYDTIIDRAGNVVTMAQQVNEGSSMTDGIDRFCSGWSVEAGYYGFVDDIHFAGEETSNGQLFALDMANETLYCVPMVGRAAFENVIALDSGDPNKIALLVGDDTAPAPLYLYVGTKNALGNGSFLDRNGLAVGRLYAWKADNGNTTPQQFNGTGSSRTGTFVLLTQYDALKAGMPGYDSLGYANQSTLYSQATTAGAFFFSRPEDLAANPQDGTQATFVTTGRGSLYPAELWGDTYIAEFTLSGTPTATLTIIYDGDDAGAGRFTGPDYGLRNPDNLDWASDGYIYIQEDRSTEPASLFGATSGEEASIWQLDPVSGDLVRVARIDRSGVPSGQTDPNPADIGNWESSGILDVTHLFQTFPGEVLLIGDVQAHNLTGAPLGAPNQPGQLVEGGQLFLLSNRGGPVPTLFSRFEAKALNFSAELRWSVMDEAELESFRLVRDGAVTATLGRDERSFVDESVKPGAEYEYVLVAVDRIGDETQSMAVRVTIPKSAIELHPNQPNPFNPMTTIRFALPERMLVTLTVHDVAGRVVATLVNDVREAGNHAITWNANGMASGVYFAKLRAGKDEVSHKMVLLK